MSQNRYLLSNFLISLSIIWVATVCVHKLKGDRQSASVDEEKLSRKKRLAEGKLGRSATAEEIILEYKGLLKSKSPFKKSAIEKFMKEYGKITKK